jgi:glycosyltransferase involved in cell wall biosynthesis
LSASSHTSIGDGDLVKWRDALWKERAEPFQPGLARQCNGIYGFLRYPLRFFKREIGIIHDFTPLSLPGTHRPEVVSMFNAVFGMGASPYDRALANSYSTKFDAEWICGMPSDKITVAYPGPSQCIDTHASSQPVERESDHVLVVSTLQPRKNPEFILKWFLTTPLLSRHAVLSWVGPRGWLCGQLPTDRANSHGRQVRWLGVVSDAELCKLYRQATFSLYGSLYEGFGFPVLDSLLHGTPVLASYNSSLREFEGPGVYYFDPCDPATVDEACRRLLEDSPLHFSREDLRESCSWDGVAETLLELCA